ncbi:unnamed protein product [Blepharisma stoltei]|uniref:Peptidase M14 domain-containing protein n=1 Tax=Blepharisma stoltei TaxID=1481888 RepID=A0AAU9JVR3_9CILI|nr:unnamed protein product [Blepharisma stoltei]
MSILMESEFPAALPLVQKNYSLEPDMIFGWKPKTLTNGGPIPLYFHYNNLPVLTDIQTNTKSEVIYHGYRPRDTFAMHKFFTQAKGAYPYDFSTPMTSALEYLSKKIAQKPDPSGWAFERMKPNLDEKCMVFDSFFESGNLDKVVRINDEEYDLYMRTDANTYGNYKWFYFSAENKAPEKRKTNFHVLNFKTNYNLMTQGMKPVYSKDNKSWHYITSDVQYGNSKLNRVCKKGRFFMLSFDFHFDKEEKVYFALSIPYRYSDLINFLKIMPRTVTQETLCKSLSGVDVPLLTITDLDTPYNEKKYIVVIARAHPSETVGSWIVQGLIDYLSKNERAPRKLKKRFIFKIIPMTNPDGVIIGNSRVNLSGDDPNRIYSEPNSVIHPITCAIKKLIEGLCNSPQGVLAFFDIHGHFRKKGSFMYGPHFPLHSEKYCRVRVLPKLISEQTPMFRYYSCKFRAEKSKRQAARLFFSREMGISNCYTFENSLYGYLDEQRNTHIYTLKHLETLSHHLINAIYQFHLMQVQEEQEKAAKAQKRKEKKKKLKKKKEDLKDSLLRAHDKLRTAPTAIEVKRIFRNRNDAPIHTMKELITIIKQDKNEDSSSASSQSESEENAEENIEARNIVISAIKEFDKLADTRVNIREMIYKSTGNISQKVDNRKSRSKTPGKKVRSSSLLRLSSPLRSFECKRLPSVRRKSKNSDDNNLESSIRVCIPHIDNFEKSEQVSRCPGSDPSSPTRERIDSSFDINKRIRTPHFAQSYFGRNQRMRHLKSNSREEHKNQVTMINLVDMIEVEEPVAKVRKKQMPTKNENVAKYHKFGPFPSLALFNAKTAQYM